VDSRLRRVAVLGVVAAASAFAAGADGAVTGAWEGQLTALDELHYHPQARLVVSSARVTAEFAGLTGAAHDAQSATTTCSVVYRFRLQATRWRYYLQSGGARLTGAGYVQNTPCIAPPNDVLLRVRLVAGGAKLQVEFAQGGRYLKDLEADYVAGYRAFLRR
jgi:hypothetical protein